MAPTILPRDTEVQCTTPRCRACLKPGSVHTKSLEPCQTCLLVSYCSAACQLKDWPTHMDDCLSPMALPNWMPAFEMEKRLPDFSPVDSAKDLQALLDVMSSNPNAETSTSTSANANADADAHVDADASAEMDGHANPCRDKFAYNPNTSERRCLYGRSPAIDILALHSNEDPEGEESLRVLFAASCDLRSLIRTVNKLPVGFKRPLHFHINDQDWHVTSRNLILLILALASTDPLADPLATAEIAVHFWYSAFIPSWCYFSIREKVLPIIDKYGPRIGTQLSGDEMAKPIEAKWNWSHSSLRAKVSKARYMLLKALFHPLPGFDTEQAMQQARDASKRGVHGHQDHYDFSLFLIHPEHRVAKKRFLDTLCISPFDQGAGDELVYNPSFFAQGSYPIEPLADPLEGWYWSDVLSCSLLPSTVNDLHGAFFYFMRAQVFTFITKLRSLKTTFEISCHPAEDLGQEFPDARFDRIDVSTLADNRWLNNCQMLSTIGPLLQPASVNPHATLISLHREIIPELFKAKICKKCDGSLASELAQELGDYSRDTRLFKAFMAWAEISDLRPEHLCRASFWENYYGVSYLRDPRKAWELYRRINHFDTAAAASGMRMKRVHTVVAKWPMESDLDVDEETGRANTLCREGLQGLVATGMEATSRFVEWKRAVDPKANKKTAREEKRKRQAHEGDDFDHQLHYGHFHHGLTCRRRW